MTYNQTKVNGVSMPLLMGCTKPSVIEVAEEFVISYDSLTQISRMECIRPYGTKSLKAVNTQKKNSSGGSFSVMDRKNEIDDTKYI